MRTAIVYTETVLHSGDETHQVAIVEFASGERTTVPIHGRRVAIGDAVIETVEGWRRV